MPKKRRQYIIRQYKFQHIQETDEGLTIESAKAKEYPNSENILFNTLYRILDKQYNQDEVAENRLDELFILKAKDISDNQLALFERVMREGVHVDGQKYVRFGKSSSMAMGQRTLFIREDLHDQLKEYISLGKIPAKTTISKYETALGLTLSSVNLISGMPKICIVKDLKNSLTSDVKAVLPFKPNKVGPDYQAFLKIENAENERKNAYESKWEEVGDQFDFKKLPRFIGDSAKLKSAWERENRRVTVEQLDFPVGWKEFKEKKYPVYKMEQTEEIQVLLNKYSIGYEVKVLQQHENEIDPHDGQALMSFEYAKIASKALGLSYMSNALQFRMPYMKGLAISFDLKSWFGERGVFKIIDLWGNEHDIIDVDIIMTESCFKAKLESNDSEGSQWLFDSLEEYLLLLEMFGHDNIGITNYAKSAEMLDLYTPITYQFINSLNLDKDDLRDLIRPVWDVYMNVLYKGDTATVKAFLSMIHHDDEEESEYDDHLATDIHRAIEINERMIFDPRVQAFIRRQIERVIKNLAIGRIPVKGNYRFVTGDCVALTEWITYGDADRTDGFLEADQFYCAGVHGDYVMMRNPLTSWHEVKKANFVSSDHRYVQHLDNIIQFSSGKDLTMAQLSGCNFDGDKVLLVNNETIYQSVIEDYIIVNVDDGITAPAKDYNMDSIIEFEIKNLSNETALVTNVSTYFQSLALEKGDLRSRELEIATCKQLQAEFIDSVKKGTNPNPKIPTVLKETARTKPFFQKFIYGGDEREYTMIYSPLNEVAKGLDGWLDKAKKAPKSVFDIHYLDISTLELITDRSKVDDKTFTELSQKLAPIYNRYANEKGMLWEEEKRINKLRMNDDEREEWEQLSKRYKELYERTAIACREVCDNESVLATVCAYIEYMFTKDNSRSSEMFSRTKSYIFPWIVAPQGILENLKWHEDTIKISVKEVPFLNGRDKEFRGILEVKDGIARIEDMQFELELSDGKYRLLSILGYHFVDFDEEREVIVEVPTSGKLPSLEDELELRRLENYPIRLLGNISDGHSLEKQIDGKEISIGYNGNYLSVFQDGEYVCGIRSEDIHNVVDGIYLDRYVGQSFVITVMKATNKSLDVTLNQL